MAALAAPVGRTPRPTTRAQAAKEQSWHEGRSVGPCCVEAVSRVRKMNIFSLSGRKNLIDTFGLRMSLLVVSGRFFYNVLLSQDSFRANTQ